MRNNVSRASFFPFAALLAALFSCLLSASKLKQVVALLELKLPPKPILA